MRWIPVPVHLLQKSNTKAGRDEVFASAEVTDDRSRGVERSAREYARRWEWSPGSVIRFLNDDTNFIDFSTLNRGGTPEATNNGASGDGEEQGLDRMLFKVNKTAAKQIRNNNGTPEATNNGASGDGEEQGLDSNKSKSEPLFNKEREKEDPCPSSSSKALFDLWNTTVEGPPLSKVRELNSERQKKSAARLKERSIEEWADIFRRLATISSGMQSDKGQWMNFDWIIKNNNNATKVLEGQYDWLSSTSRQSDNRYSEIFAGA
ncbi:MAG: hypothetical protein PHN92_02070 [Geobacter sp.]|nr:hypothetical protein [Geobacter sp.]